MSESRRTRTLNKLLDFQERLKRRRKKKQISLSPPHWFQLKTFRAAVPLFCKAGVHSVSWRCWSPKSGPGGVGPRPRPADGHDPSLLSCQLITGFPNYPGALSSCGSRNREGLLGRLMTWGWAGLISEDGRKCLLYARDLVQEREDVTPPPRDSESNHLYFISSPSPALHSILT